jgi:hypothetical protein
MKELDLTKAKWLKIWLTKVGEYKSRQVNNCQTDICTLTKMCAWSTIAGAGKLIIMLVFILAALFILFTLVSALSYFTVLLPEGMQAPYWMIDISPILVLGYLVLTIFVGLGLHGENQIELFPEYMKSYKSATVKEKVPSPTWVAIKEMYKSFKNKTCIKVKL